MNPLPRLVVPDRVSDAAATRAMRSVHRLAGGRHDARMSLARGAVFAAAVGQIWMAIPGLTHGDGHGLTHHAARHMGSLGLAMAFAFALVAWQPHRAISMTPLLGVLFSSLIATSLIDLSAGRTMMIAELAHVPEVVGCIAVGFIAYISRRRARRVLAA